MTAALTNRPDPDISASVRLYLASQSPRRRELLAQIGVAPCLLLPGPDEDAEALEAERPGELPRDYVERVTRLKADAAALRWHRRHLSPAPILCADTTVALDGRILGKPQDAEDAMRILRLLSGRMHEVHTAVTVSVPTGTSEDASAASFLLSPPPFTVLVAVSTSEVRFSDLDETTIGLYVKSGEPFGKAGAYGIQGHAAAFIAHLSGSYSGVMGLPLYETAQLLRHAALLR